MIKYLDSVVTDKKLDVSGQSSLSNQDLYLLSYILSRPYLTKQWESVNLSCCEIDDERFEVFHEVLTRGDGRPKPDIRDLSLSGNKLKSCSDAIAHLVCCQKVSCLNLSNNILEDLIPFERCSDILETLDISNNKLGNEKASESLLALKFLRKLKVLKLNHNDIEDNPGVNDAIGLALCSCNSLEELEIGGNTPPFKDNSMTIFTVIKEVRSCKSYEHHYNGQSGKAFAFVRILKYCDQMDYQPDSCTLRNKLLQSTKIDISHSGLDTDAGKRLSQHLHLLVNLTILDISDNNISDDATKSLTIGMLLTTSLKKFMYAGNLFSEDSKRIFRLIHQLRFTSTKSFKCTPTELKALVFILDCLSELNEEELQFIDIVSTISHIEELNFNHTGKARDYKVTSEDFKEFCTRLGWFKQLKILDVRNNKLTNKVKELLTLLMLQFPTLNTLILTGNPISNDKHAVAVFESIKNIREQTLQAIVADRNSSNMECRSIIYIMECLNRSKHLKQFNSITILDVDSKIDYANKFLENLDFLPCLNYFKINNVEGHFSDNGMKNLCEYSAQNRTLETVDLSSCNLEHFEIGNGLNYSNPLKTLKFNYSKVSCKVLSNLSLSMILFANLNQLEIEGNKLGDKGISKLYEVLLKYKNNQPGTTIAMLNLANNQLTSSSAVKIIQIVQMCNVKILNISNNNLEKIFCYFEQYEVKTLHELKISGNNHRTYNAVQFAKNMNHLKSCRSLTKLDISNNSIDEIAINTIYYSFMECVHLQEVRCDGNSAKSEIEVAFYFIKSLQTNTLTFKFPPSKIKSVLYLFRCISDNKEKLRSSDMVSSISLITELDLSHDEPTTMDYKLTSDDVNELCKVLTWLKHLKVLDVRNNNVTDEAKESLAKVMLEIGILNTIKLDGNPIFDDKHSMAVFSTIKNVREKQIHEFVDNQEGSPHMLSYSVIYIMECSTKLKNPHCFEIFDNIVTLDIDLKSDYAGKFFEFIIFLPCLKTLKINHVKYITDCGVNQLGEYLSRNRTLTTLDLSFCNLEKLNVKDRPGTTIPLKVVRLNHSNITATALLTLSLNVLQFTNLDELDLGGNCFSDMAISNMHKLNMTVTTLNLANNLLTSCQSAVEIIEIMQACKVKNLDISNNYLGSYFDHFEHCKNTTLERLNISANNHQAFNAVQFAKNISHLKSCHSLIILNISDNSIDDTAMNEIYYSFLECVHLQEVICDGNPAKNEIEVAFYFIKNLKFNFPSKNTFKCPPSKIKSVVHLFRCISNNKEKLQSSDMVSSINLITELDLSHDEPTTMDYTLTSDDVNELCKVLTWLKHLKVLDIRNNNVTDEAKESLAMVMLEISTLNTIKLDGDPIFDDKHSMAVFSTIKNVREKRIHEFVDNQEGSPHMLSHSVIYIMECSTKLKNPHCFELFYNIVTLDIDLESDYAGKFFEFIHFLPCLETLKINHVKYITDYGVNQLGEYLSRNRTLTTLDLSLCNLEKLDVKDGPGTTIPLKVTKLNHSSITATVLLKLSLNVLQFTHLDELDLGGNCFCDIAINNVHKLLLSCKSEQFSMTITTLNLANNLLTSHQSAIEVIEIMQACKVKNLDVSNNYLGSYFDHFKHCKNTALEKLNISANSHQAFNAVQFAENISHLKSCHNLKILNISNNSIDDTAMDEIYYSFLECAQLQEVICNGNPAENGIREAFEFVQNLYHQHTPIESINFRELPKATLTLISNMSLPSNDLKFPVPLASSFKNQIHQVTLIDFSGNKMKINENFICTLQNCTQVQLLNLENNDITNDTFEYLATGFLFTSKLMVSRLLLSGNPCTEEPKNEAVLQMIEELRHSSDNYHFQCIPAKFDIFLKILHLIDSVCSKPNDVAKTISLIKTLKVSYSGLSDSLKRRLENKNPVKLQSCDIKNFCKYLNYFKSLECINMAGNNITEDAKDDLIIAILRNPSIAEIHLENNPIHKIPKCCKLFETIGILRKCRNSCTFTDFPLKLEALVNILEYISNFDDKTCDITNNIEHLDISSFYQPHHNTRYGFEKLHNPHQISAGLIHYLTLFCKLKTLNLHDAYLTPESLHELSRFLCNNNTLEQLDISKNDIKGEGALIILSSLNVNSTLKELNLSNNKITGEKYKKVKRMIDSSNIKVDMSGKEPTKSSKRFPKLK